MLQRNKLAPAPPKWTGPEWSNGGPWIDCQSLQPQQRLNLRPLPQGHGSLRPTFFPAGVLAAIRSPEYFFNTLSHNPTLDPRIRRLRIALRVAIGRLSILGRQWPRERRLRHPRLLPLVGRHRGSGGPQREYRRGRLPRLCPGARPSPGRAIGERVRSPPWPPG